MEKIALDNLIGGKPTLLGGKHFDVPSPYYGDYVTTVPDSGLFDIKNAISKTAGAVTGCHKLSFDAREEILLKAARKFNPNDAALIEYVVRMTGMPTHYVKKHLAEINATLTSVPRLIRKRLGLGKNGFSHQAVAGEDLYTVFHPLDGFVYSVTPGNDPRAVAFVSAWCVALGIPALIKPSKTDAMVAQQTAEAIIGSGYPENGINIVSWDTAKPESAPKNFAIVDSASVVWAFGDDNTVDKLLRFEKKSDAAIDHFANKVVMRHASGRTAGVCDRHADIKRSARIIAESAFDWPIACNSLKAVFDASGQHEELMAHIIEITEKDYAKHAGDPMKESTRVGFVAPALLEHVSGRVCELKRLSLLNEALPTRRLSEHQATPLVVETRDKHSELLSREFSMYVLTLKECKSFTEAVEEVNESSGPSKRITINVFCDDEDKVLSTYLHAHHVKRLRHSTELDILYHEGNDYLHKLTVPQIHRVAPKRS